MFITERLKFSIKKQLDFLKISGDLNEIHVPNKKIAVAHGINLLLRTMETLSKKKRINFSSSCLIDINFIKPIIVPSNLKLVSSIKDKSIECSIFSSNILTARLSFFSSGNILENFEKEIKFKKRINIPLSNNIFKKKNKYQTDLFEVNKKLIKKEYPTLLGLIGEARVSSIINLSYFVGMIYPGQNSLLSSVQIVTNNSRKKKIVFNLNKFDERINFSNILVSAPGLNAKLNTFSKNKKITQPDLKKIKFNYKNKIANHSLQNALIIGGSRGLGELTAKILSIGMGNLTLTYNKNFIKAQNIKKELHRKNSKCNIIKIDVTNDKELKKITNLKNINSIYYFPTPSLVNLKKRTFDQNMLKNFINYFYRIPKKIISMLEKRKKKIIFFYPSSVYLNNKKEHNHLKEYLFAKTKGEKICKDNLKYVKFFSTRLPPILTDQNNHFVPIKTSNGVLDVIKFINIASLKLKKFS